MSYLKNFFLVTLISLVLIVLLSGCSTAPPTIFLPQQDLHVYSFYRNGLPFGTVDIDSSFIVISMEPAEISKTTYMRLWFLYKNNSSVPFLLEPLKAVSLEIIGEDERYDEVTPESPSRLLSIIDNEKAMNLIIQAIGGTLQAIQTKPTTIKKKMELGELQEKEWQVNDLEEKKQGVLNQTEAKMRRTVLLYDVFKNSINEGILRRNTIFPDESINGYIYFPLPERYRGWLDKYFSPSEHKYKLHISAQYGNKTVEFNPTIGE